MRVGWLVACLVPVSAAAWPVDNYVDVEKGAEKFQRVAEVEWLEVEDSSVAKVEWLESGELLITGTAPGRTLVLLYAQGAVAVWRIRVAEKGAAPKPVTSAPLLEAAKKACPGLVVGGAEAGLTATVKDNACRKALLALFETDAYKASELDLTFEMPALQAQLASIQAGLEKAGGKAQAKYVGAGLVLQGTLQPPERKRAFWEIFRRSAGRVALEDRLE